MAFPCTPSGYAYLTHEELVRECENKQRVIEFLNKERDDVSLRNAVIEEIAGATKMQNMGPHPVWCLTDKQIRALKSPDNSTRQP